MGRVCIVRNLVAELVMGRVCHGPSFLWAEMSRNPLHPWIKVSYLNNEH